MSSDESEQHWLPKPAFARRWGVSPRTVTRWHHAGLLGADSVRVVNGRDYFRADAEPGAGSPKRQAPFTIER
jgi:hypothetical protein